MHEASWNKIDTCLTVDEAWNAFAETFNTTADKHAPLVTKRMRVDSLPWLISEIREMMRNRDVHHKRIQKQKSTEEWIRNAKHEFYFSAIEENIKDSFKLWKTLKTVTATNAKTSNIESL